MRRVLVTGRGGQLATGLEAALPAQGFEPVLVGQPEFEFDRPETVAAAFAAARADAVVNCAAWTAVDAAEDDEAGAFRANALGPAMVAAHCAAAGLPLVQVSTDYVFDGRKGAPYVEDDAPNPLGAYGRTKLAGEWAALAGNPRTIVLRTAWVFSPVGSNFLRTMLRLGAEREELRVVADQVGAPTPASWIADATAMMLERGIDTPGSWHLTASGETSWHGFATAIFDQAHRLGLAPRVPRVVAIPTADYPTPARRPAYSVLDTSRLQRDFGIVPPDWRDGLESTLRELARSSWSGAATSPG
jgi:dTDP-4-dehydrorhamnose reductase